MKARLLLLAAALAAAVSCTPVEDTARTFKFRPDGTFKIVQVTDTHLSQGSSAEGRAWVYGQIADVLEAEKPDLLVMTGDIVTSGGTYAIWQELLKGIEGSGVPFAVVYGNHDREEQLSDVDLPQCFVNHPGCINTLSPEGYLEDMAVEIGSSASDKTAAVLYLMDSGDYSPVGTYWDYGWITHDQIHWYVGKSRSYAASNGNVPLPSYAFFHIPLTEYHEAYETEHMAGILGEEECPGELNSGLLSAFEENGDVHGVFVGHEHDNDYVARTGGVAMVYGRCCFHKGPGREPTNGVRVIELRQGDYGFRTWVREAEGVTGEVTYNVPVDFSLRKAAAPEGKENGLLRTWYSGGEGLFEIESNAVKGESEVVPTPRMSGKLGEGRYGAVQEGYLYIPETGCWSLHLSASDHGAVFLDDFMFRDTDYCRGQLKMNLEKGCHPIRIISECNGGNCWVKLMWRDQFSARYHEIPAGYFYLK